MATCPYCPHCQEIAANTEYEKALKALNKAKTPESTIAAQRGLHVCYETWKKASIRKQRVDSNH